jgi:hypothetical protein
MRYLIRHDGEDSNFWMHFDQVQAAAPISVEYDDECGGESRFEGTPYQTASAHHNLESAAALALGWAYRMDPESDWPSITAIEEAPEDARD